MKTIRIGREQDNDVVFSDGSVSGHHAIITFDGINYVIQDVGSKNGTFVNGNRISESRCTGSRRLDKYDVVKIGFSPVPWLSYFELGVPDKPDPVTQSTVEDPKPPEPTESNGMATAGFICSFFSPLLGVIFSILGLNKAERLNGKGHGLSVAGIVISIIRFLVALIIIFSD